LANSRKQKLIIIYYKEIDNECDGDYFINME